MFKNLCSRFYTRCAMFVAAGGGLLLVSGCDDSDAEIAEQIINTILAALDIVFTWID